MAGGLTAAAVAALAAGGVAALLAIASGIGHDPDPEHAAHGLGNDLYSYWGAGWVLNHGGNPYDQVQLGAAYRAGGVHPVLGSGYSYPLLLAQLMRPLALLSPGAAAAIFALAGLAALALATALLLGSLPHLDRRGAVTWGALIGIAPPVAGSLYVGQANLLILPLLGLACRRIAPGASLAGAAAIKLFPASGLLALLLRGRREWPELVRGLLLLALLVGLPALLSPAAAYRGRLSELLAPDPYWTNVSLNGWVSRLALPFGGIHPALGGLPVVPTVVALTIALGGATVAVLWRARRVGWAPALALAILFGVLAAPKNSIWNCVPLAVCIVAVWPLVAGHPARRRLTVAAIALIEVGSIGVLLTLLPGPPPAAVTALASLTIAGLLGFTGVTAAAALSASRGCRPSPPDPP